MTKQDEQSIIDAAREIPNLTLQEFGLIAALSAFPYDDRQAKVQGLTHLYDDLSAKFFEIDKDEILGLVNGLNRRGSISLNSDQYGWIIEIAPALSDKGFAMS